MSLRQLVDALGSARAFLKTIELDTHAFECDRTDLIQRIDDALNGEPTLTTRTGAEYRAAIARDAAARVATNVGTVQQLCYAPILWALEDADVQPPSPQPSSETTKE
jgi:hypothetical protein